MDFLLGGIILFAGNFAPQGWAFCDGSLVAVNENMALFSVLGTTYGGDGVTNFALPNLPDQNGAKHIIAIVGIYPSRA